jgi:hypothetical protein
MIVSVHEELWNSRADSMKFDTVAFLLKFSDTLCIVLNKIRQQWLYFT